MAGSVTGQAGLFRHPVGGLVAKLGPFLGLDGGFLGLVGLFPCLFGCLLEFVGTLLRPAQLLARREPAAVCGGLPPSRVQWMTRNASTSTRGCPAVPSTFSSSECAPAGTFFV